MPHKKLLDPKEQGRIWKEAKDAAGPRYTADINVELPIKEVFDGIGRTEKIYEEIEGYRKSLRDSYKSIGYLNYSKYQDSDVKKNLKKIQRYGKVYVAVAEKFGLDQSKPIDLNSVTGATDKISKYIQPVNRYIWDFERKESDEQRERAKSEGREYLGHSQSTELRELKSLEHTLRNFSRSVQGIDYFAKSHKAKLLNDPVLLILGNAGMGKTHLVCDIAKDRLSAGLPPTVIVLGEKLINIKDSTEVIFKATSIKGTKKRILSEMNDAGRKVKRRSLIIVDAINEADRRGWKSGVRALVKEIKKYPWIGLVMTCRVPFQFLYLPKRSKFITEYHQGFENNELEAMTAFFKFYGLSLPQVPLLISEFSSPLFLSCFCRTARDIKGGKAKVAKGIKDLALGQVGMTKILEDFYISKEEWIVKKHTARFKTLIKQSWIWHKSGSCLVKDMAKIMAAQGRRHLLENEVFQVIKNLSGGHYKLKTCEKVLKILIEEGVLIKDAAWDAQTKTYFDVLKFSFHKFSDHIIARYLLDSYFDSKKVRASLNATNSLGNIFSTEQSIFENIDLIEALMVEFGERIKKNSKLTDKDLIDYLPKNIRTKPQIMSAFIESLYWRKPESFLNNRGLIKKSIIDYVNKVLVRYDNSYRELLNLFVSTATKPFHPLNAKRLDVYLKGFTLTGRDLYWAEYLRKQYGSGSVYKLISWIESQSLKNMTADQAECVIIVLTWVLGTNVKSLRNRATRCLHTVGRIHPETLFKLSEKLFQIDDPYIRERLLAANYGVAMSLRDSDASLVPKILYPHAKKVYSLFFKRRAILGTTNIFIRDYARGIIEVAIYHKKALFTKNQIRRVRPPYLDGGIRRWGRSIDKDNGKYRDGNAPLGWEFEKDTLRHLVGSRPYDDEDKNYICLKENIMWRLYQLGYSLDKFGEIDKQIESDRGYDRPLNYVGRNERYGEKYSLIAYHEMMGLKLDKKQLDKWWVNEDGRDESSEIDPSFPESEEPARLFSKQLTSGPEEIKKWMVQKAPPDISHYLKVQKLNGLQGPWILVDGILSEKNIKKSRKATTFTYGVLVDKQNTSKLDEFLNALPFPGNNHIPSLPEVRSIFSGELGWREKRNPEPVLKLKIKRGERQRPLTEQEKKWYGIRISFDDAKPVKEPQIPPEFKTEPIYEEIPILRLARWFATKDSRYIGKDDDIIGMHVPSKKITKGHKLHSKSGSFYLVNNKGEVVAVPITTGKQYGTHENLLYLRESFVSEILRKTGKVLVLITWGERQYWPEDLDNIHRSDHANIVQNYKNIYKQNIIYPF